MNKFEQVLTAPIKDVDETVRVNDNGTQYHVARLEDQLVGDVLEVGGGVAIAAETVEKYGADTLVGKRVKRWVRVED